MIMRLKLVALFLFLLVCGCKQNEVPRLSEHKELGAGGDVTQTFEPRRAFPLKSGDRIEFVIGGRLIVDEYVSKELTARAIYDVEKTRNNMTTGGVEVEARYAFQPISHEIDPEILKPLFVSQLLPFQKIMEGESDSGMTSFATDVTVLNTQTKGFPFFDFEAADVNKERSPFSAGTDEFRRTILEIDPDAAIRIQAATGLFEAYFVDRRLQQVYLHELRFSLSPFGFLFNYEERVSRFVDGMRRVAADMREAELAAVFPAPVKVTRNGEVFQCSLFSRKCKSTTREDKCLSSDPNLDADPC